MIEPIVISYREYLINDLIKDRLYYVIVSKTYSFYCLNRDIHNTNGAAKIWTSDDQYHPDRREYFLNDKYYGDEYKIPSDEYWVKFCKMKAFQ